MCISLLTHCDMVVPHTLYCISISLSRQSCIGVGGSQSTHAGFIYRLVELSCYTRSSIRTSWHSPIRWQVTGRILYGSVSNCHLSRSWVIHHVVPDVLSVVFGVTPLAPRPSPVLVSEPLFADWGWMSQCLHDGMYRQLASPEHGRALVSIHSG